MTDQGPLLLIGAGRLGRALLQGWRRAGVDARRPVMVVTRTPQPDLQELAGPRVNLSPDRGALAAATTIVLCVKPAGAKEAAEAYAPLMSPDATVLSALAGVRTATLSRLFGHRPVARILPTTSVAAAAGVTTLFAPDAMAEAAAHAVMAPVSTVVALDEESLIDAATAVSASGAAYVYAFAEALAEAGRREGLPPETADRLARLTVVSAATLLAETANSPRVLIDQVASPGGTTRAALAILESEGGLADLLSHAVAAAAARSRELAASG